MQLPGIRPEFSQNLLPQTKSVEKPEGDFKTMMRQFMTDVNKLQLGVDDKVEQFAAGNIQDVHQVMIAIEEASVAFELLMEIRNKLLKAYNELMRMQV